MGESNYRRKAILSINYHLYHQATIYPHAFFNVLVASSPLSFLRQFMVSDTFLFRKPSCPRPVVLHSTGFCSGRALKTSHNATHRHGIPVLCLTHLQTSRKRCETIFVNASTPIPPQSRATTAEKLGLTSAERWVDEWMGVLPVPISPRV
ncbi:hypothetical protein BV25DRAFT_621136 [Artomyces pyxidatus]|uniref:Uncharacterized protein n=1 Tax=Artomyces pyxidatus TaxID=48021 RepID=A0ACB8T1S1_9AGAM|nr:hypothetical protein BV25DRAFT_621136 [Artomyces pyxidatus]